jgi:hypothetical protein
MTETRCAYSNGKPEGRRALVVLGIQGRITLKLILKIEGKSELIELF